VRPCLTKTTKIFVNNGKIMIKMLIFINMDLDYTEQKNALVQIARVKNDQKLGFSSVLEVLPSICKALGSNFTTTKI
jgi:hypothetical protein